MDNHSLNFRKDVLRAFGANSGAIEELVAYNENHFILSTPYASFPLPDEPFVEVWRDYARLVTRAGTLDPLRPYLVQLNFPIQKGMSGQPDYLAATRRGVWPEVTRSLEVGAPCECQLKIHPTQAGHIPVLTAGSRRDFETLVQAFSMRNEPEPIPASMGATMVAGLNNWHRIGMLRERFQSTTGNRGDWTSEFKQIKGKRELYQDRFIILSGGPYSGIAASALGLDQDAWLSLSVTIRREHECAHYFTKRVFASMRNRLLDELIADYIGMTAALGYFRPEWLLHFYGLETFPKFREGGRLGNYRGSPELSDEAFLVLQRLVYEAVLNLQRFDEHSRELGLRPGSPAVFFGLASLTVEEMASSDGSSRLAGTLDRIYCDMKRRKPISTPFGPTGMQT